MKASVFSVIRLLIVIVCLFGEWAINHRHNLVVASALVAPRFPTIRYRPTTCSRQQGPRACTALYSQWWAGDMARKVGQWVGKAKETSEWTAVITEFQIGVEQGEIQARALHAKPMDLLPTELRAAAEEKTETLPSSSNCSDQED